MQTILYFCDVLLCVLMVFYFVFLLHFALCFCGVLLCVFAVNSILMSVFKTDTVPM